MKTQPLYISLGLAFITLPVATAAPIEAVIGLNSSQIVESNQSLSLVPNPATLVPLSNNFAPIIQPQNTLYTHWFEQINHKVRVEHKHRDLAFKGELTRIEQGNRSFSLLVDDTSMMLPIDDFYLIPLEKTPQSVKTQSDAYPVSYQSNQLSWTPQLSFIFDKGQVTLAQQALLNNHSDTPITLNKSLLHYSNSAAPQLYKAERSVMAMSDASARITYQDNEITYPLGIQILTIPPHSSMLVPLPTSTSAIDQQTHQATVNTYSTRSSKVALDFYSNVQFSLPTDGLPGEYRTFWKKDNLLIPGNNVSLDSVRADSPLNVVTNKSRDITGELTLISATSETLPSTQVWRATIENHSGQAQQYSVEQNTHGFITLLEGKGVSQSSAKSVLLSGEIEANTTKTITYTVEVNK
ncbi:hypothetical protein J9B83_02520 [Marinomonas sp. A79]|uniref:DUF4139 domain-containing protein n=1 Tax=Marinomonas vulgaris TaxID=2823372 RepID=A0ABS5H7W9_9GAMM|nr:hypothetical protein [Marinomonas vulgaris]MBR7887801.1 hypothetical protein [Marinomonas vulgaris]